jgi:hypothetical protein
VSTSTGAGLIGRIVAVVALASLPLLMLLDWYQVGIDISGIASGPLQVLSPVDLPSQKVSGWEAFDSEDIAIVIVADLSLLAIALSAIRGSRVWLILGTAGCLALATILLILALSPPDIVGGLLEPFTQRLDELLPGGLPDISLPHNGIADISTDTKALAGPWIAFAASVIAFAGCGVALMAGAGPPTRRCPDCARLVSSQALVCRFCGHRFD